MCEPLQTTGYVTVFINVRDVNAYVKKKLIYTASLKKTVAKL